MPDTYHTIACPVEGLYRDRGSRFLSFAYPAEDEKTIKETTDGLRVRFHDARHHCFAYRLGLDTVKYRVNDDGEPSGTAGKPIYGQICAYGLTNILVVVVRYFGGTLLGTSGLINAYRTATKDALDNSQKIEKSITDQVDITFGYPQTAQVERLLEAFGASIIHRQFNAQCHYRVAVNKSMTAPLLENFVRLPGVVGQKSKKL